MGGRSSHQHLVLEDPLLQLNNDIKGGDLMVSISKGCVEFKDNSKPYTGDGSVDFQGRPPLKRKIGNWRACLFILVCSLAPSPFSTGNECCKRLTYYGITKNLVNYISGKLHERNVSATRSVATWAGTCYLTPLVAAFLADSYWGRYWTIAVFSIIYFIVISEFPFFLVFSFKLSLFPLRIIVTHDIVEYYGSQLRKTMTGSLMQGMCTLTPSATVPAFKPAECEGLYLIALGTGGIKPCVSSFGADQFDDTDTDERVKKGSFFNWFYFSINIGSFVSSSLIIWIQENIEWAIGFGIPAISMGVAFAFFFSGTSLYRFQRPRGSPLTRVCQVGVASWHKRKLDIPSDYGLLYRTLNLNSAIEENRKLDHTDGNLRGGSTLTRLLWLGKAAVVMHDVRKTGDFSNPWRLCSVTQVEELKILVCMFPIWAAGIVFSAVYSQMSTMFVEQGMVMTEPLDPSPSQEPPYQHSIPLAILMPVARKFTGKEKGLSEL
ncbi:LOW QUALITY PROTEIN: hypothetical protein Cgig2_001250 [Carnegiea gigantea]|uniref:Uncharacterized protein n=1 Tax=Carnegiea gigantea TaxID=171969 RepID=A0A9Q1JRQ0_9CARY|nr:LOW QUALITY PROTEIN: hypothetical protein Cgig2_001250 [Carnegiea gigantea]